VSTSNAKKKKEKKEFSFRERLLASVCCPDILLTNEIALQA
jgi:hypothetical protein